MDLAEVKAQSQWSPFLSPREFTTACDALVSTAVAAHPKQTHDRRRVCWEVSEMGGHVFVRVTRPAWRLEVDRGRRDMEDTGNEEMSDEPDAEEMARIGGATASTRTIEYQILHSCSYQVPILYFSLRGFPASASVIDQVYAEVVPEAWTDTLRDTSVLGAISQTVRKDPVTGFPVFFIHPCNTASAMAEVAKTLPISLENYLQVWLGIVGPCVGLSLP